MAQTSPGGEIAVLDTAGYGAVTITHAVSIVNEEGVEAGITVTSGDGITINAGAGDVVNLVGLTLVGAVGNNGITYNSGGVLNIQNCVIRGFQFAGLLLAPTGSTDINVSNTIVSDSAGDGIVVQPAGTGITVTGSFERVQTIHNHGDGLGLFGRSMTTGSLRALAADSLASANGIVGFSSNSDPGMVVPTLTVANSKAANNGTGVASNSNGAVFLNSSTVTGNSVGFNAVGGVINSYGNNAITDTANSGTLTHVSLQ
jgi:hypothetical protein